MEKDSEMDVENISSNNNNNDNNNSSHSSIIRTDETTRSSVVDDGEADAENYVWFPNASDDDEINHGDDYESDEEILVEFQNNSDTDNSNDSNDDDGGGNSNNDDVNELDETVRDISQNAFEIDKQFFHPCKRGSAYWCDFHPKFENFITIGSENNTFFTTCVTYGVYCESQKFKDTVCRVEYNYTGDYLAAGDMSGTVELYKNSSVLPSTTERFGLPIKCPENAQLWTENIGETLEWMFWHNRSNVLFACKDDGTIFYWKLPEGLCKVIPGTGVRSEIGALSADGKKIIVGYSDHSIKVFDLHSQSLLVHYTFADVTSHNSNDANDDNDDSDSMVGDSDHSGDSVDATDIDVLNDDTFAATFTNGDVILASYKKNAVYLKLEHMYSAESVKFIQYNNMKLFAFGYRDGVQIWDMETKAMRHHVRMESVTWVLWDKKHKLLYAIESRGFFAAIDVSVGKIVSFYESYGEHVVFHAKISKNDNFLVICSNKVYEGFDLNQVYKKIQKRFKRVGQSSAMEL